jgi:hypothetical protein
MEKLLICNCNASGRVRARIQQKMGSASVDCLVASICIAFNGCALMHRTQGLKETFGRIGSSAEKEVHKKYPRPHWAKVGCPPHEGQPPGMDQIQTWKMSHFPSSRGPYGSASEEIGDWNPDSEGWWDGRPRWTNYVQSHLCFILSHHHSDAW